MGVLLFMPLPFDSSPVIRCILGYLLCIQCFVVGLTTLFLQLDTILNSGYRQPNLTALYSATACVRHAIPQRLTLSITVDVQARHCFLLLTHLIDQAVATGPPVYVLKLTPSPVSSLDQTRSTQMAIGAICLADLA